MSVTLITGASSGIGRQLARRLAAKGDAIAAVARRQDLLATLVTEIERAGARAIALPCDVTDRERVSEAVREATRALGPIDRLVANAGGGHKLGVDEFRAKVVDAAVQLNVIGVAHCIEAVLPAMLQRGNGHIVATSSLAGYRGLPGGAAYSAAKSALSTMMESLRVDLKPRGIDVTLIAPGFVRQRPDRKSKPFMLELEPAAEIIARAIVARKRACAFPWPLAAFVGLARCLPAPLYDRLASALYGKVAGAKKNG